MKSEKKKAAPGTVGKVLFHIKKYRFLLCLSILLATVTVILTLYVPILIGRAVDAMVEAGQVDFSVILPTLTRIIVIVTLTGLAQWIMNTVNNRITYEVVRDLRNDAFARIQKLPLSYLDAHPTGSIVSRVITDADQFAEGLLMGFT